jgi:hypothetical protein
MDNRNSENVWAKLKQQNRRCGKGKVNPAALASNDFPVFHHRFTNNWK